MKPFDDMSRTEIEQLATEWIHNQRDREVVLRRLTDGIVFEKLAEEFNLSVTQIKNICYKSICILATHVV